MANSSKISQLTVVENEKQQLNEPKYKIFNVEKQIKQVDLETHDQIYATLSNADIHLNVDLPVYEIAWKHIIKSGTGNLLQMVLIYKQLEDEINDKNIDTLICNKDLNESTVAVVSDLGDKYDIDVKYNQQSKRKLTIVKKFVTNFFLMLPFLVDQIICCFLKQIIKKPNSTSTVFVPSIGRLKSSYPVLEKFDKDSEIIVTAPRSPIGQRYLRSGLEDFMKRFDPTPSTLYTNLEVLIQQTSLWTTLNYNIFIKREFNSNIRDLLISELDVEMNKTIEYALQNAFKKQLFTSLFHYYIFDSIIEDLECNQIIIGSLSPLGKAITAKGIEKNIAVYHIPHSIATARSPNPPPEITQFVSGERDREFYESTPQVEEIWNIAVTGRPYLTQLYKERTKYVSNRIWSGSDRLKILIATQPLPYRKSFVNTVISAIQSTDIDAEITIKTHPGEDRSAYSEFQSHNVKIKEKNLFEQLGESDLTITMNSNVGLESVIIGTPSVCVNKWEPLILSPTYAEEDIPVLRSNKETERFFDKLDPDFLEELKNKQQKYIHKKYELDTDAAVNIVQYLSDNS